MLRIERIFEAGRDRRGARRIQPADSRRREPQGDDADRVRRRRRAQARARRSCAASRTSSSSPSARTRPCGAIADEDLDRSNETKTSAVHFLRFELAPAAGRGAPCGRAARVRGRASALRGARERRARSARGAARRPRLSAARGPAGASARRRRRARIKIAGLFRRPDPMDDRAPPTLAEAAPMCVAERIRAPRRAR